MAADFNSLENGMKPKTFWQRPEGITGALFLGGLIVGGGYLFTKYLDQIVHLAENTLYLSGMLVALGGLLYMILDPKMRNLVWYIYKSIMRWFTGIFVTIDPIGILKSYIESLQDNLSKMSKQIGNLRGQMRQLQTLMEGNKQEMDQSMKLASKAKELNQDNQVILHTRKAARLQESNGKYDVLHKKMEILNKVLVKMYENSEILLEDTKDQVQLKEQEYKAIKASHSAMTSAMNIIRGDKDKKQMFDMALEHIADDVSQKVGEMERFMEMSGNFMNSIDLQNGVFEEEGLKMLDEWENKSKLMLMDTGGKSGSGTIETLELKPIEKPAQESSDGNNYDNMFK